MTPLGCLAIPSRVLCHCDTKDRDCQHYPTAKHTVHRFLLLSCFVLCVVTLSEWSVVYGQRPQWKCLPPNRQGSASVASGHLLCARSSRRVTVTKQLVGAAQLAGTPPAAAAGAAGLSSMAVGAWVARAWVAGLPL